MYELFSFKESKILRKILEKFKNALLHLIKIKKIILFEKLILKWLIYSSKESK